MLATRQLVIDIPGRRDGAALDLDIEPGRVWGVLGPNGAGKTTLLLTLAGLRAPRHGTVLLDGQSLERLSRRTVARSMAVVFQERSDGFPATVMETALIGRHPYLAPWQSETADDMMIAQSALARLDLQEMAARDVTTLSGGERQRLAVATALTQTPRIWLVDEPTNHLDLHHQVEVMQLLSEQADVEGCAVFICMHDINLAARWCDDLLLLYPGGEACWGPAGKMLDPRALERLYGQALTTADMDGKPVFVPAGTRERSAGRASR